MQSVFVFRLDVLGHFLNHFCHVVHVGCALLVSHLLGDGVAFGERVEVLRQSSQHLHYVLAPVLHVHLVILIQQQCFVLLPEVLHLVVLYIQALVEQRFVVVVPHEGAYWVVVPSQQQKGGQWGCRGVARVACPVINFKQCLQLLLESRRYLVDDCAFLQEDINLIECTCRDQDRHELLECTGDELAGGGGGKFQGFLKNTGVPRAELHFVAAVQCVAQVQLLQCLQMPRQELVFAECLHHIGCNPGYREDVDTCILGSIFEILQDSLVGIGMDQIASLDLSIFLPCELQFLDR